MKASKKIILFIGFLTVVGLVIYLMRRHQTNRLNQQVAERMNEQVAEQGYETAHDILFPKNHQQGRRVQYGPVIPV